MQSPALTPTKDGSGEVSEEKSRKINSISKRKLDSYDSTDQQEHDEEAPHSKQKKPKLETPDRSSATPVPENLSGSVEDGEDLQLTQEISQSHSLQSSVGDEPLKEKKLTKKEQQKIERQKQREIERIEKEKKKEEERLKKIAEKEEERLRKEEEKSKKEEERLRKITEKEAEKELKRRKLEEEKLEKERKKEEERLQKQAEKEEKEKQRLEKKRKQEEEKERKELDKKKAEEEKKKAEELKERSQMKISSFFQIGGRKAKSAENESVSTIKKQEEKSDYDLDFLPFFVQKNVVMASSGQFDHDHLEEAKNSFDNKLKKSTECKSEIASYFQSFKSKSEKSEESITPEFIVSALNSSTTTESQIHKMLKQFPPMKYISFYENSKPPYVGTWCSERHQKIEIPTSNPVDTSLTGFDYDYDSDLEWNKEEEEGEDVDNEDDEEEDDMIVQDDDELDDFVEDNQDGARSKKFHSLVVINKWNDGTNDDFFANLTTTPLVTNLQFPIDPFHDYWNTSPKKSAKAKGNKSAQSSPTKIVQASVSETIATTNSTADSPNILIPQKKTIDDPKLLSNLIVFIEKNNEFTIGTMVELSKKEFKDYTKALLKNTIQSIAEYNKKTSNWEVRPEMRSKYALKTTGN
ncbi:chromatin assembly complex, subunit p90 [Scheffersomyces xylosifermentans]|uniref:chromatin assembly complex, subunit p90 n=1 Tax=Scheffersomyces xylosifermentans TaxID=1304137 RepID=UPI00315CAABD